MVAHKKACASSPAAMFYWLAASLAAWGVLSLIGICWYPLHALSAVTILLAMAIGCTANWLRNCSLHCVITAPIFLIAALVFLLPRVNSLWVWPFVFAGTAIAFLLEWKLSRSHPD